MNQQNALVNIIIEQPLANTNEYTWDEHARAIRLSRAVYAETLIPLERGIVAHSLTLHGEPVQALLVINLPTFTGCWVGARVIGAVERLEGESTVYAIIAVANGDACLNDIHRLADLADPARDAIQGLLHNHARWLDGMEASQLVHAARQRWALAHAENTSEQTIPAWQVDTGHFDPFRRAIETTRYSPAESRLWTLPTRFQNYVATLLLPDERILAWVHRPLMAQARLGIFRRETLRQGVLVITDQQFLWMVDPVTPTLDVEGYGYVARTFAIERLCDVLLELDGKRLRLTVALNNAQGNLESLSIDFPTSAQDDLNQVVRLLNRFLPRANETRLARRKPLEPLRRILDDPMTSDKELVRATVARLQDALTRELNGEMIYAQGFVPEWGDGARLITVTERFIRITHDPRNRATPIPSIPLATIGTVEVCHSVLGSWFRVWLPNDQPLTHWELDLPPVIVGAFSDCAVALRFLLAGRGELSDAPQSEKDK